jgi:hypothetical protein
MLVALGAGAAPAYAQNQGVTFTVGYFAPKDRTAASPAMCCNADRCLDVTFQCEPLLFGGERFRRRHVRRRNTNIGTRDSLLRGGLAGRLLAGRPCPAFTRSSRGPTDPKSSRISSSASSPITGLVRFIPTGRHAAIQPYIGGRRRPALKWHYAESGEFVDPSDGSIFAAQYIRRRDRSRSHRCRRPARPMGDAFMIGGECGGRKPRPT